MSCHIATIQNKFKFGTAESGPSHAKELQVSLAWVQERNEVVGIFTLTARQATRLAQLLIRRVDGDITATGSNLDLRF